MEISVLVRKLRSTMASQPTSVCPLSCRSATPKLQIYGSFDAGLKLGRPFSLSLFAASPPPNKLVRFGTLKLI